jgi:hypothetical protein
MRIKLTEVLLASPSGQAIREALRLGSEKLMTEMFYVRVHRIRERESSCDMRVCVAKWGPDMTLTGEAVEVSFQCLDLQTLQYAYDENYSGFEHLQAGLDIDTEDRFRILCGSIVVTNVRPFVLGEETFEQIAAANAGKPRPLE